MIKIKLALIHVIVVLLARICAIIAQKCNGCKSTQDLT